MTLRFLSTSISIDQQSCSAPINLLVQVLGSLGAQDRLSMCAFDLLQVFQYGPPDFDGAPFDVVTCFWIWRSVFGTPDASQTHTWTDDPAHQDFQEPEPEG